MVCGQISLFMVSIPYTKLGIFTYFVSFIHRKTLKNERTHQQHPYLFNEMG